MKKWISLALIAALSVSSGLSFASSSAEALQKKLTPQQVVARLKAGNHAFKYKAAAPESLLLMKKGHAYGQYPLAIILACIDSRSIPEVTFSQKKGDVFTARVAGNVTDTDVLGSMEYAVGYAGTKVIVVMGHTSCGAVAAACDMNYSHPNNLKGLLNKIVPAVKMAKKIDPTGKCTDPKFIDLIAKQNVLYQIKKIMDDSSLIRKLVEEKKIILIGAIHDISTGKVTFLDKK